MTILEALKSKVQYSLPENTYTSVLIERELNGEDLYTKEITQSSSFKGAIADLHVQVANTPNYSEGNISITITEKKQLIDFANTIYRAIGEKTIGGPTAKIIDLEDA